MSLTLRQRALVHMMVQRFDRETQTTTLDPPTIASALSTDVTALAADVEELQRQGYVERVAGKGDTETEALEVLDASRPWVLSPTDRAVLSAMGLE
ncbi:MAG: hypothetical protein ACYC33_11015 [Thermoleophilia bacterium]